MASPTAERAACLPASEWDVFRSLLPPRLLDDLDPKAAQAVYTPWVVTWLLIYQRLNQNATLNDAVSEFTLRFPRQALPEGKRARHGGLSANTGAYGLARGRLDARVLYWAADHVFTSLVETYPRSWHDRPVGPDGGAAGRLPAGEQPARHLGLAHPAPGRGP
jgi:hypothetical protein